MQAQDVTRRLIFYVPGFDPFPLRRYRELYRKEAKRQAALAGYQISQLPPDPALGADWGVDSVFEGQRTFAAFIVLGWSDLVKHAMSAGILRTYVALFQTLWIYLYSRAFFDLIQMRKGPVIAALYPVVMLLSQLFIALFTAWLVSLNFSSFWLSVPFASVIFIAILRGFKALDRIFFAYYLMQDFAFSAQLRGAYPAPLLQRINAFSARIEKALKENWDEILVVGHSSGAHIAISALAQIERSAAFDQAPATVGFLSLGQVIPMVAFLPNAGQLRRDLYDISRSTAIYWVDITAPGDGCSFPFAIQLRFLRYHWLVKLALWFYPRPFRRRCPPGVGGACDGDFSSCIFNIYAPLMRPIIMITLQLRPARSPCANASAIVSRQNKCKRLPITATEKSRDRSATKAPFKT